VTPAQYQAEELLADARSMRLAAGIRQATICQALGLHVSELSMWEKHRRVMRITSRTVPYVRFLAGLRRALANQAAAAALLAEDECHAGQAVRGGSSGREEEVGACCGAGAGVVRRGDLCQPGRPVDPAGVGVAPGA
jgi:hypothetical protein